ncbi:MAG TPA: tetratricopeptide repeat protein [Micropepsaceae bacterium]|nr:tetratricopeptide repeat protein [Micropepsaceae bacterium]
MNEPVLQNALALRRAGRLAEAAAIYSEILKQQPAHFEALHALGVLRYQAGDLLAAERLIAEALLINPGAADAHYNRGSLLLKLNRHEEALACFASALAVKPDYTEAHGNRGAALMRLGRHAEALADLDAVVRLRSGSAEAWYMRGVALRRLTRYKEAHASFTKALEIKPNYSDALRSRSEASLRLENFSSALADAEQARALDPNNAEAWQLCADADVKLGRPEAALASYDRALALKPGTPDVIYNRATTLLTLRRFDEAIQGFGQVLQIDPDYPFARGSLVFGKLCNADWRDLDDEIAAARAAMRRGTLLAPFHTLILSAPEEQLHEVARAFSAQKFPPAPEPLWKGEIYRHDRIRIAYLSGNFHNHVVARLLADVFEHHDHERFEIFAFSFGPDDKSQMRARLEHAFDHFVDIQSERPELTAHRLRELEIDIAIDLMGFTEDCRPTILPHRPAPVQVNYLGYAGTMGADYIDYIIADRTVIPNDSSTHYSETVARLPHSYLPGGGTRSISESTPSRASAGLPGRGFVFCAFHHVYKITPRMFDIWMRLLGSVEESVLWLPRTGANAAANLKREATARGIAPDRLVFANFVATDADHLARLRLADLFLDALPYNAHGTACDALLAGVPLITVSGESFPGRVAASLLRAVGMEDMIAPSLAAYESMALGFARDPAALRAIRARLAANLRTAPLFDTARFTRDLESAYRTMWERSQNGLAPQSFAVERTP